MVSRRLLVQFVAVMALMGLTFGLLTQGHLLTAEPTPTAQEAVLGAVPFSPTEGAASHVIEVGFQYPPDLRRPPTGEKDQSKLWYHSAAWWGVLASRDGGAFTIHRLDWSSRSWLDTGVVVDDRLDARADVLWDGAHLYVASAATTGAEAGHIRLSRYTYFPDTGLHVLDPGFPVALNDRGVAGLSLTGDAANGVWVTSIVDGVLVLRHSGDGGVTWTPPIAMDRAGANVVAHTVVVNGDSVALLWTNQVDGTVLFSSHAAGDPPEVWDEPESIAEGAFLTDDHIIARSLDGPEGPSLFAIVKTSRDLEPDSDRGDPQMLLLNRDADGEWRRYVVGRVRDRHTRPLLVIEEDRRILHIFVVAPFGAGAVFYKSTSADTISLASGPGAPFLELPDHDEITSPTSTKQNVTGASGLVVLASDLESEQYVMGALPLR